VSASTTSITPDPSTNNNAAGISVVVGFAVEGIPALNGYGLILLGLLIGMLGFVGMRREE